MLTGMFIRSIETAERSNVGMQCRNYQSGVTMFRQPKGMSYQWPVLCVAVFIMLFQVNDYCVRSGILMG